MQKILVFLTISLFILFSSAVTEAWGSFQTVAEPLYVGIDPSFRPFAFKNEAKELVGLDMDFLHRLAERSGLSFNVVEIPYEDLLSSLTSDRIHIAFVGMAGNVRERPEILLSKEYYIIPDAVITKADKVQPEDIKDLEKASISFPAEMGYDSFIQTLDPSCMLPSDNFFEVLDNVVENSADAAILDKRLAEDMLSFDSLYSVDLFLAFELRMPGRGMVLATKRNNPYLMKKLNHSIDEISMEGFIGILEKKWFRKDPAFPFPVGTYSN